MKLIVVSDSHGRSDRLAAVMDMHRDADALIFLGDGLRDLDRADAYSYGFTVYSVVGNCDGFSYLRPANQSPEEITLSFEGFRIYMLHGHTRAVKNGIDRAVAAANSKGADILLYGHTHVGAEKYCPEGSEFPFGKLERPLWIFNPGSLGASADGKGHFGLIQIRNGSVLTSHGTV